MILGFLTNQPGGCVFFFNQTKHGDFWLLNHIEPTKHGDFWLLNHIEPTKKMCDFTNLTLGDWTNQTWRIFHVIYEDILRFFSKTNEDW